MAERLTVDQEVAGSSPVIHPNAVFHACGDLLTEGIS